jgi:hypothetical protein
MLSNFMHVVLYTHHLFELVPWILFGVMRSLLSLLFRLDFSIGNLDCVKAGHCEIFGNDGIFPDGRAHGALARDTLHLCGLSRRAVAVYGCVTGSVLVKEFVDAGSKVSRWLKMRLAGLDGTMIVVLRHFYIQRRHTDTANSAVLLLIAAALCRSILYCMPTGIAVCWLAGLMALFDGLMIDDVIVIVCTVESTV